MRVYFTNLGCKLNQAELEALARRFSAAGHSIAGSLGEAELHVVNTCTVTHAAARDSRKVARRGRRLSPGMRTVLTGCHVAAEPEEAAALAGVDLVVPNDAKHELLERVHAAFPEDRPLGADGPLEIPYVPLAFGNSRALVKVEDGCNMRCSFCIIPATRGAQQSRPVEEILAEVRGLASGGFQEVVVTGVQISAYRDGTLRLYDLVETLVRETGVPRLRLTSIAPWQFDRRLLELFDSGRVCRHFHLSLQSGCDSTLERMRRPYSTAEYAALLAEIRTVVPGVAITTDWIVGFPAESEAEFEQSLAFVESCRFARIHAFPFSPRPGTEAAALPSQIAPTEIKRRMRLALEVADRAARRFRDGQLGSTAEVLWEQRRGELWTGTTDNYVPVVGLHAGVAAGRIERVGLERHSGDSPLAVPLHRPAGAAPASRRCDQEAALRPLADEAPSHPLSHGAGAA